MSASPLSAPHRIESASGLVVRLNANGSLHRLDHADIVLNLFLGNELEGGPANLYLRRLGDAFAAVPLLGPRSPGRARLEEGRFQVTGEWEGIRFQIELVLAAAAPAWFWHLSLENAGPAAVELDLIHAQDLALAPYGAVRLNEFYVSQYLDHAPLRHPERGWTIATRQNQPMGGRHPWCLMGSLGRGVGFATDALQVHGLASRAGRCPEGVAAGLPGIRRQHEHAMAAIQDEPVRLAPGETVQRGFFGWFLPHHPEASGTADLGAVDAALALPEARPPRLPALSAAPGSSPATLFSAAPLLETRELSEAEIDGLFGSERHAEERDAEGRLLSFFTGKRRHVVLKTKELAVLRPHGHILRTGNALTADESALTSTVWMAGVFHSMVTQGHVSINRFLSTVHGYLGLFRSHGQRLFVHLEEGWRLLDQPSAFEMAPEACRWIYRHEDGLLEVRATAASDRHELGLQIDILSGNPLGFLLASHVALNGDDGAAAVPALMNPDGAGVLVRAVADSDVGRRFPQGAFYLGPRADTLILRQGGDELLFGDGASRGQPYVCFVTAPALSLGFNMLGRLLPENPGLSSADADLFWRDLTAGLSLYPPADSPCAEDARCLADILPWFVHNGLIHYLSPRGLEQYSGGGWGTRDVTQGPVELLLGLGRFEPIRDLLLRVFRNQNPDGDWPQWFMFFERERGIRPGDSHGDIVFWPVLALAQYLIASGDGAFLDETVPFFHPEPAQAERTTVEGHVERALRLIGERVIRIGASALAAYGHGDWNDSLQPADPSFRERLCSSWTVTLHYRTLRYLAEAMRRLGRGNAAALEAQAAAVLGAFQQHLIVDGVLAGFAHLDADGRLRPMLHPADPEAMDADGRVRWPSYSLLPMIHAIIDGLFSAEQARGHLALIERELLGPDGARLFDQPFEYRGGLMTRFQRAESSSFFGREIGLMYTHAHLRYCEALWQVGDAESFFRMLRKAVPIGLGAHVPAAAPRQANCYYSSSDAAFRDRYQAQEEYGCCLAGEISFEGGWRVYSSGAGIATGLLFRCLLGLRMEAARLVIDPVLPKELDGLRADLELRGLRFEVTYHVGARGAGPLALELNGRALPFDRLANPYRTGGAEVAMAALRAGLVEDGNRLVVRLG